MRHTIRLFENTISSFARELRYTVRGLKPSRGFTATVVFTLMLGIGTKTAVFSVVDGMLFRALTYRDADRLVRWDGGNNSSKQSGCRSAISSVATFRPSH